MNIIRLLILFTAVFSSGCGKGVDYETQKFHTYTLQQIYESLTTFSTPGNFIVTCVKYEGDDLLIVGGKSYSASSNGLAKFIRNVPNQAWVKTAQISRYDPSKYHTKIYLEDHSFLWIEIYTSDRIKIKARRGEVSNCTYPPSWTLEKLSPIK